jgi:hypothetical protein
MPRFYFDLVKRSGVALRDERGAEFPDLPAAIADAEQGFAEILGDATLAVQPSDFVAVNIRLHRRNLLITLRFDGKGKPLGTG